MLIENLTKDNVIIQFEHNIDMKCRSLVIQELKECGYDSLKPEDIDSISSVPELGIKYEVEKLKQIKRHRDANRSSLAFSELLSMCEQLGYNFKRRSTKPAKLTIKMPKINSVSGQISLGLSEINEIGRSLNIEVFNRFEKGNSSVDVPPCDQRIMEIWINSTEKIINKTSMISTSYIPDQVFNYPTEVPVEMTNPPACDQISYVSYTSVNPQSCISVNTQNNVMPQYSNPQYVNPQNYEYYPQTYENVTYPQMYGNVSYPQDYESVTDQQYINPTLLEFPRNFNESSYTESIFESTNTFNQNNNGVSGVDNPNPDYRAGYSNY